MQTSSTIKFNQVQPPRILLKRKNAWKVGGRRQGHYWVTRNSKTFYCKCLAGKRGSLCRHVQAVVLYLASEANMVEVSFWTKKSDAEANPEGFAEFLAKDEPRAQCHPKRIGVDE